MNMAQTFYESNKINQKSGTTKVENVIKSLNRSVKSDSVFNDKSENDKFLSAEEKVKKYTQDMTELLHHIFDPTNGMDDEQKEKYRRKILAKIHAGKELTAEEMRYVQINMPELYPQVVRIQLQRKSLEERLKHCNSKEEAQKVYEQAVSNISEKDHVAKELYAAYEDVMKEYKKTDAYAALPQTEEEAKDNKNKKNNTNVSHKDLSHNNTECNIEYTGIKTDSTANTIDAGYFPDDNMSMSSMDITA